MAGQKRTVPAASLVLDFNLYPRHRVDETNVRRISAAMLLGEPIPPIVADAASKRVVDGFHRVQAALRRDPDATITAQFNPYVSDAAILLDAVRLNARHGATLTAYDHARVISLTDTMHIDRDTVAAALAIPIATLERIKASRTAYKSDGKPVMIKRSFRRLRGETLTDTQVAANEKASGWSARFHAEQILNLMAADAIDWDDEPTRDTLARLADTLIAQASPA